MASTADTSSADWQARIFPAQFDVISYLLPFHDDRGADPRKRTGSSCSCSFRSCERARVDPLSSLCGSQSVATRSIAPCHNLETRIFLGFLCLARVDFPEGAIGAMTQLRKIHAFWVQCARKIHALRCNADFRKIHAFEVQWTAAVSDARSGLICGTRP